MPLRSLTNRSSLGRKTIPHGTSKPSTKFSTKKVSSSVISKDSSQSCVSLAFVEQEKIGSGIKVIDATDKENEDMEQRLLREGAKSGVVQISLAWDDYNDLDLHLFCPSGERIYFNNRTSECGGELDVDMNVRPTSDSAVENIVWIDDAPLGQYKVGVHFYKHHNRDHTTPKCAFRLRLTIHGEVRNYSGNISHGQAMQMVTSFTLNDKKNSLNQ